MSTGPDPDGRDPDQVYSVPSGDVNQAGVDWQSRATAALKEVSELIALLDLPGQSDIQAKIATRLRDCVMRPLRLSQAGTEPTPGPDSPPAGGATLPEADDRVWKLATSLAPLVGCPDLPVTVSEAAAALIRLAWRGPQVPEAADKTARREQLDKLVAEVEPRIVVSSAGPLLATNVPEIVNWLGVSIELPAHVALCRCGASARKPLCDGSHARAGFSAPMSECPTGQPEEYPSPALTVLDNRTLCSQSLLCSQRLGGVFHEGQSPFVTPGGGRMDEIIRAVRECPSGALSVAIDGRVAREVVDNADRQPRIEVSLDGPYRVTGTISLLDEVYNDARRAPGASREHYTLCRCGQSSRMPFCSGRHRELHFADPIPDRERVPSLFEWAGGLPALTRLTRRFYEAHVPADALIGPLFARSGSDHPERVAAWLAEVFGGPNIYSSTYGGFTGMMTSHLGRHFSEPQRARFVELLCKSADDVGLPADPEFRAAFVAYLEWGSRIATETSRPGARPPRNMQMPVWGWLRDAVPGSRPPSFSEHEKLPTPAIPEAGVPVSFALHIRPLFRRMDRRAMSYAFDLWDAASVRLYADRILARIEQGTMPVDQPWPAESTQLLRRWIDSGMED